MKYLIANVLLVFASLFASAQSNGTEKAQIQLIRNVTIVIDYNGKKILLDPMFSPKGAIGSWAGEIETPTVDLPMPIDEITKDIDMVLVTHTHADHFDKPASDALDKNIKLFGQPADKQHFLNEMFWNSEVIADSVVYDGITIIRTNAQHGTGRPLKYMGDASGFVLKADNQPTVYIIGDGVWTQEIYDNIVKFQPDYIVVNSGGAYPTGPYGATPIIMDEIQVMALLQESGDTPVIAVHMDAVDRCRTTRKVLRNEADKGKIAPGKLIIPADGEIIKLK